MRVATHEEYEQLWSTWAEFSDRRDLIDGSWVKPSLTLEQFRLACRRLGWRLPAGFIRAR